MTPQEKARATRQEHREAQARKRADIEAPDFPAELMQQAEEASRAFNAQAEDATKAMQEYIERGERRQ